MTKRLLSGDKGRKKLLDEMKKLREESSLWKYGREGTCRICGRTSSLEIRLTLGRELDEKTWKGWYEARCQICWFSYASQLKYDRFKEEDALGWLIVGRRRLKKRVGYGLVGWSEEVAEGLDAVERQYVEDMARYGRASLEEDGMEFDPYVLLEGLRKKDEDEE